MLHATFIFYLPTCFFFTFFFTQWIQTVLNKHGCQLLQALIIHDLGRDWFPPLGISADVSPAWVLIRVPPPQKKACVF